MNTTRLNNIHEPSRRIAWIDHAKALTIVLVVLLHTHCNPAVSHAITACCMPTFFFLSGYLFSPERNPSFRRFAAKRFRQLIVPYIWIGILSFPFILYFRNFDLIYSGLSTAESLTGFLLGIPAMLEYNDPLWCFPCFYIVELACYPLLRRGISPFWIIAGSVAGTCLLSLAGPDFAGHLPYALGPAIPSLGFYAAGYACRRHGFGRPGVLRIVGNPVTVLVTGSAFWLAQSANSYAAYYTCDLGNLPLFYIASVTGALALIGICVLPARIFGNPKLTRFISVNSLLICGLHVPMFYLIITAAWYLFHLKPIELRSGLLTGIPYTLLTVALTLPICYAVTRWLPFLTDKRWLPKPASEGGADTPGNK